MLILIFLFILSNSVLANFNFTQSIYNFSVATFQRVNKNNANFIMSPLSTQIMLALTYDGAFGKTAQALNAGLNLIGQTQVQATNDFSTLIKSLMKLNGNTSLNIANKIYINNNFQINPVFKSNASKYHTSVATISFTNNANAANSINAWTAQKTNGNIQEIVQASQFNNQTVMVLVNAIYFQGLWINQFPPDNTKPGVFYTSQTTSQEILMMSTENIFNYGYIAQLNATAIQMLYTDQTVSMLFLLPKARDGLLDLVNNRLGLVRVTSILNQMTTTLVQVQIPRFTINMNIDFRSALQELGMGIIFDNDADFNNMVTHVPPGEHLAVSSVIQQTFIEVTEYGSITSAITVAPIQETSSSFSNEIFYKFIADHPFVMMILKDTDIFIIGCFVQGISLAPDPSHSFLNPFTSLSAAD